MGINAPCSRHIRKLHVIAAGVPHLCIICLLLVLCLSVKTAWAESVFLKDGSIVEGKTLKVGDEVIEVAIAGGKSRSIQRKDILRTIFDEGYKTLRYMYLKDGREIEGYIVAEDTLSYTCRTKLDSKHELKIPKNGVTTISSERIAPGQGRALTPEEELRSRYAFLRIGTGLKGLSGSEPGSGNESMVPPLCVDAFLYRMRDEKGNGFDLFARYSFNNYASGTVSENTGYVYDRFGITVTPPGATIYGVEYYRNSFAGGLRYVNDFHYNGILWQCYGMGYYQFSRINMKISGPSMDKYYVYYSHGISAGAGIEAALTPMLGLFAELTWGYSPAFPAEKNTEGGFLRVGAVLRVPDLM